MRRCGMWWGSIGHFEIIAQLLNRVLIYIVLQKYKNDNFRFKIIFWRNGLPGFFSIFIFESAGLHPRARYVKEFIFLLYDNLPQRKRFPNRTMFLSSQFRYLYIIFFNNRNKRINMYRMNILLKCCIYQ